MSYSVCYRCLEMVPYYDKYCAACRMKFSVPDLPDYQKGKSFPSDDERSKIFEQDLETAGGEA